MRVRLTWTCAIRCPRHLRVSVGCDHDARFGRHRVLRQGVVLSRSGRHKSVVIKDEGALGGADARARSEGVGEGNIAPNVGLRRVRRVRRRHRWWGILGIHVDGRRCVGVSGE